MIDWIMKKILGEDGYEEMGATIGLILFVFMFIISVPAIVLLILALAHVCK